MRAYRPVRLYRPTNPQVTETLTKDLSVGGIRCISSTVFPVSTELTIELSLSTGEEVFAARGRTAWFRMLPKSDQMDIGIVFTDVSQENKIRLSAYIDRLSSHPAQTQV